jgi:predicted DNA-binding protein
MLGDVVKKSGMGKKEIKKQFRVSSEISETLSNITKTLNMSETDFLNLIIYHSGKDLENYFEAIKFLEEEKENKAFTLNLYTEREFIGLEPVGNPQNPQWLNRWEEKRVNIQNSYTNLNFKYWLAITVTTYGDNGVPVRTVVRNNYTDDLISLFFEMEQKLKLDKTNLVDILKIKD